MNLSGQAVRRVRREHGYAMAVLLVAIGVMAILMTAAMPVWKQMAQREKEEELVFRGNQYARAIGLYQRKNANRNPPNLDVLLEQHFLRKKFKDPMASDGEFQLLYLGAQTGAQTGGGIIGVTSKNPAESLRAYNGRTHYNEWQFMPVQQTTKPGGPGGPGGPGVPGGPGGPAGPAPPGR